MSEILSAKAASENASRKAIARDCWRRKGVMGSKQTDYSKGRQSVSVMAECAAADTIDIPMATSVRDFVPEDFETLWRIDQECFPPGIAYSRAELLHYINRRASFGIVATAESVIVGFLVGEISRRRKA